MNEARTEHSRASRFPRGRVVAVILLIVALLTVGPLGELAGAIEATSGTLTMTSDPDDWIGGGASFQYTTGAGDRFDSTSDGSVVRIQMNSPLFEWWHLTFAAPAGERLVPRTYDGAVQAFTPVSGAPGLDVSGNGRSCSHVTGSFTVLDVTYGPYNYLERFHATFEQQCDWSAGALRGEVFVVNPPAPTPLELAVTADTTGTVDRLNGTATVGGTVTCTSPASVLISGTLSQRVSRTLVNRAGIYAEVACSGTTTWQATVSSYSVPFNPGPAALEVRAVSYDAVYGRHPTAATDITVRLAPRTR